MNDKTYRLLIGSNNDTGKLEADKIIAITLKHFDGATITLNHIGIWRGGQEKSAEVLVVANEEKLFNYIDELKEELKQDAVGWSITQKLNFR